MFLSIAERVDNSIPVGSRWHTDLLNQMTFDLPSIRPPALSRATRNVLHEYRSFRRLVRNVYTYNLDPEKVAAPVDHISPTYGRR